MRRLALLAASGAAADCRRRAGAAAGSGNRACRQAGETLSGVAQRAGVPRILIIEANRLTEPYALRAGQKLTIPRTRHHTVGAGDTRFTISYLYGVPWQDIAVANGIEPAAALKPGQKLLIPSVIAAPAARPLRLPAQRSRGHRSCRDLRFAWPLAGTVSGAASRARAQRQLSRRPRYSRARWHRRARQRGGQSAVRRRRTAPVRQTGRRRSWRRLCRAPMLSSAGSR